MRRSKLFPRILSVLTLYSLIAPSAHALKGHDIPVSERELSLLRSAVTRSWQTTLKYHGCREVMGRTGMYVNTHPLYEESSFAMLYGEIKSLELSPRHTVYERSSSTSWGAKGEIRTSTGNAFQYEASGIDLLTSNPVFAVSIQPLVPINARAVYATAKPDRYSAEELAAEISLANSDQPVNLRGWTSEDGDVTAEELAAWNQDAVAQKGKASARSVEMAKKYLQRAGVGAPDKYLGEPTLVSVSYDGGVVYQFRLSVGRLPVGRSTAPLNFDGQLFLHVIVRNEALSTEIADIELRADWPVGPVRVKR